MVSNRAVLNLSTIELPPITSIWLTAPNDDFCLSNFILSRIASIQPQAALLATGSLPSTATDILTLHLLAPKITFRESAPIICLPPSHPLHSPIPKRVYTGHWV